MAPEQVRGEPADHRSDLFALGCVLYEMLTGERAYKRETAAETMSAILREDPPDPSTLNVTVPPGVLRALRRCLEKRPQERFESARDLAFALESAVDSSSTSGHAASIPSRERRCDAAEQPDGADLAVVRRVDGFERLECPLGTVLYQTSGYISDIRATRSITSTPSRGCCPISTSSRD